jgi:hypothetical protein
VTDEEDEQLLNNVAKEATFPKGDARMSSAYSQIAMRHCQVAARVDRRPTRLLFRISNFEISF